MAAAKSRAKAKQEAKQAELAKASAAAASTAPVLSQQPPAPPPPIQAPVPPPPSPATAAPPQDPVPILTPAATAPATAAVAAPAPPKPEPGNSTTASPTSPNNNTNNAFAPPKTPPRKVLRLKCPTCNDYPDGFRSEHELRRHTNRVHRKARKVWMTIDTSPDQTFLANCKACQSGKKYNECYNAASHLRRMHFHPHKRGERKMSAAEARRGGKPGDLDPPMEVLKTSWLKEVDEVVGGEDEEMADAEPEPPTPVAVERPQLPVPPAKKVEARAPPTPTTPSTRSMAIESIVDKVDAS
ncbi:hypothetical protein BU16DRAFT_194871 [Lophium mytilinum]|uniref:DUF7896 domain-containing protein n=1 Tax=Lophium mytilinum TaxID=390894 RepID=A0A6A6RCT8_9PEZI|nr:hypothetical protein BU16DRAFT_194871 [Lophium mytilinum]